jgi:hypothetical protein
MPNSDFIHQLIKEGIETNLQFLNLLTFVTFAAALGFSHTSVDKLL